MGSSRSYISFCISVSPSVRPRCFLAIICATHNFTQRMRMQVTGSNPLSYSIICPSVRLYSRARAFYNFGICIDFQCGGPAPQCIYISFHPSVRPSVCPIVPSSRRPMISSSRRPVVPSYRRPVVCGPFAIFVFVLISNVGLFQPQTRKKT